MATTAKIKLSHITVAERNVEVPLICPECSADLTVKNAVVIHGWQAASQSATLAQEVGIAEWGDDPEDHYEASYSTEVHCGECETLLAGGPPEEEQ